MALGNIERIRGGLDFDIRLARSTFGGFRGRGCVLQAGNVVESARNSLFALEASINAEKRVSWFTKLAPAFDVEPASAPTPAVRSLSGPELLKKHKAVYFGASHTVRLTGGFSYNGDNGTGDPSGGTKTNPKVFARSGQGYRYALGHFRRVIPERAHPIALVLAITNDTGTPNALDRVVMPAIKEMIAIARDNGVHLVLGTLPPLGGCTYGWSDSERQMRIANVDEINTYLRSLATEPGVSVIDFNCAAFRDVNDSKRLSDEFDAGDGLHLNEKGQQKMRNMIDTMLTQLT